MTLSAQVSAHDVDALIRVQGADAASFLNAQLTRRVDNLAEGETALAAWCNAKGRVQALFRVSHAAGAYTLRMPAVMVPLTLPRLRMYVLRSQVQFSEIGDTTVPGHRGPLENVLTGIPQIYPETREQFLPQMLNLDQLNAVDFKKGCYPGQEIVARAQYLGQLKRRMYRFKTDAADRPAPGTSLFAADGANGTVIDAARDDSGCCQLLAVVPIESMQEDWHLGGKDGPHLGLQTLPYPLP
jgi:folate-binding protein YgfZ